MDLQLHRRRARVPRARSAQWVAENLPKDISHKVHNALRLSRDDLQRWAKILGQEGLARLGLAEAVRRPGLERDPEAPVRRGMRAGRRAAHHPVRPGDGGAGDHGLRHAGAAEALPARHRAAARCGGARATASPARARDLASLKTRAERRGDKYIVNGQKTWTTLGQYGDWIFCLVRTSNEGKPQTGISFLLIDMKSPGVTVRPIITARRRARGQRGLLRQRRGAGRQPDRRGEQGLDLRQAPARARAHQHRRREPRQARAGAAQAHRQGREASTTTRASATRSRCSRSTSWRWR